MNRRFQFFFAAGCAAMLAGSTLGGPDIGDSVQQFLEQNPRSNIHFGQDGRPARLYGKSFAHGRSPEDAAANFFARYGGIWGANLGEFVPIEHPERGGIVQGVMYNRITGEYKQSLIAYRQEVDGIPVFRSSLQLLIRNDADYPVVLAGGTIRDLTGLQVPGGGAGIDAGFEVDRRTRNRMQRRAERAIGGDAVPVGDSELVIWAGLEGMVVEPRLAVAFTLETDITQPGYSKFLYLADAETGDILYQEDQVHYFTDVNGNVSGNATDGIGADICHPEVPMGLPYADVRIQGGNSTFADVNGDFVIPHGGNQQVTVESRIRGRWFEVRDQARGGGVPILTQNVTPPGPANFLHNSANTSELDRANVNAYLHANVIRDSVLFYAPDYPTIGNQQFFTVNTNINNNCNAFYNGSSINFYTSGGGCTNTANSTVVYHEYGHHLVNVGSSGGQGAYGEGMSDTVAVVITDDPNLGLAFQGNCNVPLRSADNNCQYDPNSCTSNCGQAIHSCGRLMSGCAWSLRNELIQTEPQDYLDILRQLTFESIRLHNYSGINPQITIDYLTLDDDDDDISNGTPHYQEIATAFGDHNMDAPPLQLLSFNYPNGRPDFVSPGGGTNMVVEVAAISIDPQPGTGILHVDRGSGFEEFPMEETSDNVYLATFPSSTCGEEIRYYVSAETVNGDVVTSPSNAPTTSFSAISGSDGGVALSDDFETDMGWTIENINLTDGAWARGVPVNGNRGDPPADHDGSGRCYVTDNVAGNSDVDGGPTILTSPRLRLGDGNEYIVSYARWFHNSTNGNRDFMDVQISNNLGESWTTVERVLDNGNGNSWVEREFVVSDYVNPNNRVLVRFVTQDQPNDSIVEAGVDAFKVFAIQCEEIATLADLDVIEGTIQQGGLPELQSSDDQFLKIEALVTGEVAEPHRIDMVVGAFSGVQNANAISITLEAKASDIDVVTSIQLRDWNTNDFVEVDSYSIGMNETTNTTNVINAGPYVRGGDGRIEVRVFQINVFPFTLGGYIGCFDHLEIAVQ